jgi:hypothetical protein
MKTDKVVHIYSRNELKATYIVYVALDYKTEQDSIDYVKHMLDRQLVLFDSIDDIYQLKYINSYSKRHNKNITYVCVFNQ